MVYMQARGYLTSVLCVDQENLRSDDITFSRRAMERTTQRNTRQHLLYHPL